MCFVSSCRGLSVDVFTYHDVHALAIDGPIASLTFNRPDARNALTWEMYDALAARVRPRRSRILTSACSSSKAPARRSPPGTDIAQFTTLSTREDALAYERRLDSDHRPARTRRRRDDRAGRRRRGRRRLRHRAGLRPARLHAGGAIRRADRAHARQLPVGRPTTRASWTWSGRRTSRICMFTGRLIDAAEARALGLVTRMAEPRDRSTRSCASWRERSPPTRR